MIPSFILDYANQLRTPFLSICTLAHIHTHFLQSQLDSIPSTVEQRTTLHTHEAQLHIVRIHIPSTTNLVAIVKSHATTQNNLRFSLLNNQQMIPRCQEVRVS